MNKERKNRLVRIKYIVGEDGVLPIGVSSWWLGIKKGYYPKPIKLSPNVSCWKLSDIENLIENGFSDGGAND